MNAIKISRFYSVLAALLSIGLLFHLLVLQPINHKILSKLKKLEKEQQTAQKILNKRKFSNQKIINFHLQQKKKLTREKAQILHFFRKKDQFIEKWFKEIEAKIREGKESDLSEFRAIYAMKKKALRKEYFHESFLMLEPPLIPTDNIVISLTMKQAQKKYWIVKGALEILKRGKMLHVEKFQVAKWASEQEFFEKYLLSVEGKIVIEEVPQLIKKILNNPFFLTTIKSVKVKKIAYTPPEIVLNVPWYNKKREERLRKAKREYLQQSSLLKYDKIPVNVSIQWFIWDYNSPITIHG